MCLTPSCVQILQFYQIISYCRNHILVYLPRRFVPRRSPCALPATARGAARSPSLPLSLSLSLYIYIYKYKYIYIYIYIYKQIHLNYIIYLPRRFAQRRSPCAWPATARGAARVGTPRHNNHHKQLSKPSTVTFVPSRVQIKGCYGRDRAVSPSVRVLSRGQPQPEEQRAEPRVVGGQQPFHKRRSVCRLLDAVKRFASNPSNFGVKTMSQLE